VRFAAAMEVLQRPLPDAEILGGEYS